jgi:hypothetical protein
LSGYENGERMRSFPTRPAPVPGPAGVFVFPEVDSIGRRGSEGAFVGWEPDQPKTGQPGTARSQRRNSVRYRVGFSRRSPLRATTGLAEYPNKRMDPTGW